MHYASIEGSQWTQGRQHLFVALQGKADFVEALL
jgi:hypothetical protein